MKRIVFFIGIILLLASCKAVFVPTPVNVPMFTNRGELQLNANIGLFGFSPQIAYAFSNHLGGALNVAISGMPNNDTNSYQYSFGPSVGYFYKYKKLRLELYTGLEWGQLGSAYSYGNNSYWERYSFRTLYFQPTVGYASKLVDFGFSSNLVIVSFQQLAATNTYSTIYWEPILTGKIGYKRVRFLTQLGLAIDLSKEQDLVIFPFAFSLGININFGKARYIGRTVGRYEGR